MTTDTTRIDPLAVAWAQSGAWDPYCRLCRREVLGIVAEGEARTLAADESVKNAYLGIAA